LIVTNIEFIMSQHVVCTTMLQLFNKATNRILSAL